MKQRRCVAQALRRVSWMLICASIAMACQFSKDVPNCERHDDCWKSPAAQALGRCAPQVLCESDVCRAWCPEVCSVAQEDVNPCSDQGFVCNEPRSSSSSTPSFCVAHPIGCTTAEQCPRYRPSFEHQWECIDGLCRFAGFSYASENAD